MATRSSFVAIGWTAVRNHSKGVTTVLKSSSRWQSHKTVLDEDSSGTRSGSRQQQPLLEENKATIIQGPSLLTDTSVHRPSPSLFYLPGLRSLPFWTAPSSSSSVVKNRIAYDDPTVTRAVRLLEDNYEPIKAEYMSAVLGTGSNHNDNNMLEPDYLHSSNKEGEHTRLHSGTWDWHSYMLHGTFQPKFANACPHTAQLIQQLNEDDLLFTGTPFGFCFFSTLQGHSSIQSHCAPMNLRLRIHLPLLVPPSSNTEKKDCAIRVAHQSRTWQPEGKALVFDDSYLHKVWNETDHIRVILLVDIWHPDITTNEKRHIRSMFEYAKDQGWIGHKNTNANNNT